MVFQIPVYIRVLRAMHSQVLSGSPVRTVSMTLLYYRVVIWFCRRYCTEHYRASQITQSDGSDTERPGRLGLSQVLARVGPAISALAAAAYDVYVSHEVPSES